MRRFLGKVLARASPASRRPGVGDDHALQLLREIERQPRPIVPGYKISRETEEIGRFSQGKQVNLISA